MRSRLTVLLIIFAFLSFSKAVLAQQSNNLLWTSKTAKQWFKKKDWAPLLKIKGHSSISCLEFAKQYNANKGWWDEAFTFLNSKKLDSLAPGKYIINGSNVYATITEAPSKEFSQSTWESHRNYIDLQYVITGKEKIGVAPVLSATIIKPYDETKDLTNYTADGIFYKAGSDHFFLFFPSDAHRPNIKVDGYYIVKKLVIKIKYTSEL